MCALLGFCQFENESEWKITILTCCIVQYMPYGLRRASKYVFTNTHRTGQMNCVVLNVVMNNQVCHMLSKYPVVSIDIFKTKRKLKLLCYTDHRLILQNENNKLVYNFSLCSGYIVFFKINFGLKKSASRICRSLIYLHMSPSVIHRAKVCISSLVCLSIP